MLNIESTLKLNSGYDIPLLGFGTFQIAEGDECVRAVREALDAGYRHIDTAAFYGNEVSVGKAVCESGIDREKIYVTTKLWKDHFARGQSRSEAEASLQRLGTEYIDLHLLHWPIKETERMMEAWEDLQTLRDEGKIRSIGVSNFTVARCERAWFPHTDEAPAVNQIERHPWWSQMDLLEYSRDKGIVLEAYSPLARGEKLSNPTVREIAASHGKTPAQVLIRWELEQDVVVIPKSTHAERIRENADVFDFALSDEEMGKLNALNADESVINYRTHDDWY